MPFESDSGFIADAVAPRPINIPGLGKVQFDFAPGVDPTELNAVKEKLTGKPTSGFIADAPYQATTQAHPVEYAGPRKFGTRLGDVLRSVLKPPTNALPTEDVFRTGIEDVSQPAATASKKEFLPDVQPPTALQRLAMGPVGTGIKKVLGLARQVGGAPEAATGESMVEAYKHSREQLDQPLRDIFGPAGEGMSHTIAGARVAGGAPFSVFVPRFIQEGMGPVVDMIGKGYGEISRVLNVPEPIAKTIESLTPDAVMIAGFTAFHTAFGRDPTNAAQLKKATQSPKFKASFIDEAKARMAEREKAGTEPAFVEELRKAGEETAGPSRAEYRLQPEGKIELYRAVTAEEYAEFQKTGIIKRGAANRATTDPAEAEFYRLRRGPDAQVIKFEANVDDVQVGGKKGAGHYRVMRDIDTRAPTVRELRPEEPIELREEVRPPAETPPPEAPGAPGGPGTTIRPKEAVRAGASKDPIEGLSDDGLINMAEAYGTSSENSLNLWPASDRVLLEKAGLISKEKRIDPDGDIYMVDVVDTAPLLVERDRRFEAGRAARIERSRAETQPLEGQAPAVEAATVPETYQGSDPAVLTAKEVVTKIEEQQAPEHFDKAKITKQVEKGGEIYVKTEVDPNALKVPGEKTVEPGVSAPEKGPIVVDDKGKVIDGRHRTVDAKAAGETAIEAYVPSEEPARIVQLPKERRAQLEQAIADGEMRLRTRKNAIGERLSGKEIAATRKAVAQAKEELAAIAEEPPISVKIIKPEIAEDYRGLHTAPMRDSGSPLDDLKNTYPEDIYSVNGARYYGHWGDARDLASIRIIQQMRGKPNATVRIYRAVPRNLTNAENIVNLEKQKAYILKYGKIPPKVKTGLERSAYYDKISNEVDRLKALPLETGRAVPKINPGDWVTIDRSYAKEHGETTLSGDFRVVGKNVKAQDIFTNGDSIHEWGYDPQVPSTVAKPKTAQPEAKIVQIPKPRIATENQSLSGFVANEGGISLQKSGDLTGEFRAIRENGNKGRTVIKAKAGKSADLMAQAAHDAGFIESPDPALLAEALGKDLRGEPVYSTKGERFQTQLDRQAGRDLALGDEVQMEAEAKVKQADIVQARVPLEYEGKIYEKATAEKDGVRLTDDVDQVISKPEEILSVEKRPDLAKEAPFDIPAEAPDVAPIKKTAAQVIQEVRSKPPSSEGAWDRSAETRYRDRFVVPIAKLLERKPWRTATDYANEAPFNRTERASASVLRSMKELGENVELAYLEDGTPVYALRGTPRPKEVYSEAEWAAKFEPKPVSAPDISLTKEAGKITKEQKAYNATGEGQKVMAARASRIAVLTQINEAIRKVKPSEAYDRALLEKTPDSQIDLMQESLRQDYNRLVAKPRVSVVELGDYVQARTAGGNSFNGEISKQWPDGRISIIPDGAKNSIEIDPNQVIKIEQRRGQPFEEVKPVVPELPPDISLTKEGGMTHREFIASGKTEAEWDVYAAEQNQLSRERGQAVIAEKWRSGSVAGNDIANLLRSRGVVIPENIKKALQHDDTTVSVTSVSGRGMSRTEASRIHKWVSEQMITTEAGTKPPWEMTRDAFNEQRREQTGYYNRDAQGQKYAKSDFTDEHDAAVEVALRKGEPVPRENLPSWAMSAKEAARRSDDLLDKSFRDQHRETVSKALSEGKPVPPEVLAEYPDLVKPRVEPKAAEPTIEVVDAATRNDVTVGERSMGTNQEPVIRQMLEEAQRKGEPAWSDGDYVYTRTGKFRLKEEGGAPVFENKLSEDGVLRNFSPEDENYTSSNRVIREMKAEREAGMESRRQTEEARLQESHARINKWREAQSQREQDYLAELDKNVKSLKFQRGPVKIPLRNGEVKTVEGALLSDHFAIHKMEHEKGWIITHRGTGLKTGYGGTIQQAKGIVARLESIPGANWTFTDAKAMSKGTAVPAGKIARGLEVVPESFKPITEPPFNMGDEVIYKEAKPGRTPFDPKYIQKHEAKVMKVYPDGTVDIQLRGKGRGKQTGHFDRVSPNDLELREMPKPKAPQAEGPSPLEKAAEGPDLSQTGFADLIKKGLGSETGAVGKLTPEQQAIEAEARAARKEIYRRLTVEVAKTGEALEAVAERMKLPPGALQKLQAEQEAPRTVEPPRTTAPEGEFTTGIKNATVDEVLAEMGEPPATRGASLKTEEAAAWAVQQVKDDPFAGQKLVNELAGNKRPPTGNEVALLTHEWTRLVKERKLAEYQADEAVKSGDPDAIKQAKARVDGAKADVMTAGDILAQSGTESSHSLSFRKMMMKEDYSLAAMERTERISIGEKWKSMTEAERETRMAEVKALHEKINATEKALDDYMAGSKAREAEAAAAEAHYRMLLEAKQEPIIKIDPRITMFAERIVKSLENEAEAASVRFNAKASRLSVVAVLDPTLISDGAIMVAAKIARTGLEFGKWSVEMINEHGPKIQAYLNPIWQAANKLIDKRTEKLPEAIKEKVVRAIKKTDVIEQRAVVKDQIRAKVAGEEGPDIGPQAQKLARLFVEQGVKDRNALIDAVHSELKDILPDITRQETMDAISGRGKFSLPSQDEISKTVRDLKTQIRLVSHQMDVEAGKPLPRTGYQPEKMSDAARREQQILDELKKRYGVTVTDPAAQLESVLTARKTYYRNQISDLEAQIAAKEKFVKEKTASPTDAELEGLKARRNELKEEFDKIFGTPGLTDQQRVTMAIRGVAKSIADLEQRIKTGDIGPRTLLSKTPSTPELEAMRARQDALREQLQELRDAATPKKTPEQIALQSLKTRLANNTADLLDRIARGDFSKRPKREVKFDSEANRFSFENAKVKAEFQQRQIENQLANRSLPQKIIGGIGEAVNTTRAVLTSMDLSAVLRQGGFIAFGHPIRALKAFPDMFRAMLSEAGQHRVNQEILSRENYPLYKRAKLYLSEQGQTLSQMEEAYMSRWADKIPGVAASQRAYTTFLNKLRADSFDAMANSLGRGSEVTSEEANAIANFVNVATGRGTLGMKDNAAVGLNTIFFAPRYVASRFELLAGQPLYRGTLRSKILIAGEYARFLTGAAMVYGLAQMAGAEVETDPRSSDFGKIRFGNTRIDPMMGLSQVTVLLSRLTTGETKSLDKGKIIPIRGDKVPYGGANSADVMARFLRSKLSPVVGASVDVLTGKNVVGQPVTPESVAGNLAVPLAIQDVYQAMQDQGVPKGAAMGVLAIFGMNIQSFNAHQRSKPDRRTFGQRMESLGGNLGMMEKGR